MVGIQLHDPIHKSQSQSSQPIGGTPFENTTNLDSLIHSLNFPSYHACLLAGGMVCTSHLRSAQPISEPKQKDGMTSDPESLSAETGRHLLLACIRKISYRSTLDCIHPLICRPFNPSLFPFSRMYPWESPFLHIPASLG